MIQNDIVAEAQAQGMDPALALEVAIAESSLNPQAESSKGAYGLFQLTQGTADLLGVDRYDVAQNIEGGIRYLGMQLMRFGDTAAALGAFNWGPERVDRARAQFGDAWLDHAPTETQNYVSRILGNLQTQYTAQLDIPGGIKRTREEAKQMLQDPEVVRQLVWILALTAGAWLLLNLVSREA